MRTPRTGIGRATARFLARQAHCGRPRRAVAVRRSSARPSCAASAKRARTLLDIGLVSTPMLYFGVDALGAAGGIMLTASHNPAQYNGFKLCGEQRGPDRRSERPARDRAHRGRAARCAARAARRAREQGHRGWLRASRARDRSRRDGTAARRDRLRQRHGGGRPRAAARATSAARRAALLRAGRHASRTTRPIRSSSRTCATSARP